MNAEKLTPPENRIDFAMSREKYDRLQRANWSSLKLLLKSPAHYRHNLTTQRPDTTALKLGRATHVHVYEPERVRSTVTVWDGDRRAGKVWQAFKKKNDGLDILTKAEDAQVRAIAGAVRGNATAAKYVSEGRSEPTLLWTYRAPGFEALPAIEVECKGRPDFIATCGSLVDLKTCVDAGPEAFGRTAFTYGYHIQAAFYADAYEIITGQRLPYRLIAVEKAAPFVVQVYRLPDDVLEIGRQRYRALLSQLAMCSTESKWPGYADGELDLILPKWAAPHTDEDASGLELEFTNPEEGA